MLEVHGMALSFNTMKVLYTLEELAVDYNFTNLDISKGENKTDEHFKRHPLGKTPTLTLDDGSSLFESGAICRYLANKYKPELIGKSDFQKAQADQWMDFFSNHAGRWLGTLSFEKVIRVKFAMGEPKQDVIKDAESFLEQQLGMVNQQLTNNKFLAGNEISIADIFAFAYVETIEESKYPLDNFPAVKTWYSFLKERPSINATKKKFKG